MRTLQFGRRAGYVAFLALLIIFTWEVCARVQDYVQLGVPPLVAKYTAPPLYAYAAGGPRGIPFAVNGEYRMNSLGFRSPELIAGAETILCLGASETFGIGTTDGKEYPRRLESDLNAGGTARYQVVNAGLPGERIEEIAATLPKTLEVLRPAYAVLYLPPASVIWTHERWHQLFPTDASKNPPPTTYGHVRALRRVQQVLGDALPATIWAPRRARTPAQERTALGAPTSHLPDANFNEFRDELNRTLDMLAAAHARPVIVTHATRFGPDVRYRDAQLDSFLAFYPVLTPQGLADTERRFNALLRAVAAERGLPVVDVANLIAPGPDNFYDFFHFSDVGAARVASFISEAIREDSRNRMRLDATTRRKGQGVPVADAPPAHSAL